MEEEGGRGGNGGVGRRRGEWRGGWRRREVEGWRKRGVEEEGGRGGGWRRREVEG